mmetsp:Transcript_8371/g.20814  ORF Transcript_8371/g.20814 Transcript_8371/m.20814 type:complete len:147 (+) Transcript_8371:100-540(+)|eukprot:CAMPEP_0206267058 /NCGR_PEP_ID=MMETSP0047_2-20121206/30937_1 /ASSEMBLY_ACC=CAM_ASM_000192 /TAXON_ID=195065 /ORGANISM="Chroomonas mesostigmatica_cf, Strain CCMP1168" /LENGTH=146 /DNA_ID=CAMNT_0053695217 /DNA_START=91 /DNA_END=531 /DNA_ORIENTATION=-
MSSHKKKAPGQSIDFLATGFKVTTNCAFSVKIMENFKIKSDHLLSEIKADEKGVEDFAGQILRLQQRRQFLAKRIEENKVWAANYDREFGPFVAKYREFMEQMDRLYKQAKVKHADGLKLLMEHFAYHPEFKRWSDTFSAVPFRPM